LQIYKLQREQWLAAPIEKVFAFFSDASNLETITPAWLNFRIVTPKPIAMHIGATIEYRIAWHNIPLRWFTEIQDWQPNVQFVDTQTRGPYKLWHHTHTFSTRDGGTLMGDTVRYALPLGILGAVAHRFTVRRDLERVFDYRTERISALFGDPSQHSRILQGRLLRV